MSVQEVAAIRELGGFEALSDERLQLLVVAAQPLVARDLRKLGLNPEPSVRAHLVALKACELAARRVRTPMAESGGGLSATYTPLSWRMEYAKELTREYLAAGGEPGRGVL